ncbi:uncharacterized protein CELE_T04B2.8 [Caenorhabditis elegans]|uniref:Secreted protein n=1 Tax=Caenorhabditis elegans TaxID=6239 RepID=Q5FC70_CAEEL|nr:Secreted protein [Caenorhabditis elegans]CAI46584.1 Secreted protein [Caenorhabditis elegans]|eukprot:NP_001023356.1 Uncharacterized protein CELE_T04B2.8 [Caenorhabditis elegans]
MSFVIFGLEALNTFYFNLVFLCGFLGYLVFNCGVCDTASPAECQDPYGCDSNQGHSPSRESVGFDINPAMSPVFEKGATESNFDLNIFDEPKESSWWNVKVLCGGGSSASL